MNAKQTLNRLQTEYNKVSQELKEEAQPNKFWVIPARGYNETENHYWRVTYFKYRNHNEDQRMKVNRLNSIRDDLYKQITRIKTINIVKRFFIA